MHPGATNRLPIPVLTPLVLRAVQDQAGALGLRRDDVSVQYVLNWGGFGNASYQAGDGRRRVHLKLTADAAEQDALRRWQRCGSLLQGRYHGPTIVGWLEVAGTAYQGLAFEFIDGQHLDGFQMPDVLGELLSVLGRLHADADLAGELAPVGPHRTYLDCLESRYLETLRQDLREVAAEPPPFVGPARLNWLGEQVGLLGQLARDSGAFAGAAREVVHWDVWWDNVLVSPAGDWYLLDWDDVGPGDPAMDFAGAVFPLTCGPAARRWQDLPIPAADEAFAARMALYHRALMLDMVIDVLADWVECRVAPESQAEVRARKRAEHEQFLRLYQAEYGRG
jgi:hypothetical protein